MGGAQLRKLRTRRTKFAIFIGLECCETISALHSHFQSEYALIGAFKLTFELLIGNTASFHIILEWNWREKVKLEKELTPHLQGSNFPRF